MAPEKLLDLTAAPRLTLEVPVGDVLDGLDEELVEVVLVRELFLDVEDSDFFEVLEESVFLGLLPFGQVEKVTGAIDGALSPGRPGRPRKLLRYCGCHDVLAEDNGPVTMNGSKQLVPRGAVHNAGVPVGRVHGDRCRPENDVGSAARSLEDVEPDGDPGGDPMMMYSASARKPAKH